MCVDIAEDIWTSDSFSLLPLLDAAVLCETLVSSCVLKMTLKSYAPHFVSTSEVHVKYLHIVAYFENTRQSNLIVPSRFEISVVLKLLHIYRVGQKSGATDS